MSGDTGMRCGFDTSSVLKMKKENTAQKRKFSIKNFFSKCYQIREKLRIWSHLLKKSLMENFIFCTLKARSLRKYLFRRWFIDRGSR